MTAAGPVSPSARRRAVQWLLLAAIVVIPIVGIAWLLLPRATCACPPPASAAPPASPVDGVVVAVDSAGLGQVRGFTLRASGSGLDFDFRLGLLENATAFSPSHLSEHMATSEPIRVWYRLEDGMPVAFRVEDAPG